MVRPKGAKKASDFNLRYLGQFRKIIFVQKLNMFRLTG